MKMRHVSRYSGHHCRKSIGSCGSHLFYLSHLIALFFSLSQENRNMEYICKLILIGKNGYHSYPSPLAVALVGTKGGRY